MISASILSFLGLLANLMMMVSCLPQFSDFFSNFGILGIFGKNVSLTPLEIKMNEKNYYRALNKPIGSLNKNRFIRTMEQYEKMKKDKCKKHQPHFYNSFYSTPGYVVFFYMRTIPELILKLQNGPFGPSERIFKSLESLWMNMHSTGSNLTELIPE